MFQNGVDPLSKIVDAFLSKSSKFYLVRIIRKCSNFASLLHKHLLRNYKWHFDFRCQHLQRQNEIPYRNINFSHLILHSSSFMFPLLLITVEVKNTIRNSLITMFTTSWRNLIKIGWSELYKILSLFLQKAVSHVYHSDISLAPFWKRFLQVIQFHDAKGFKTRLPSFVIPKIAVVWHMEPE